MSAFARPRSSEPMRTQRPHTRDRTPRLLPARQLRTLAACLRGPPRQSGIAGTRWSAVRIQRLLRKRFGVVLSARHAVRRLRQAGVRVKLVRAREPQLSPRALEQLRQALRRPPNAVGLTGERWSRRRIAELIERRFKRRYTPAHAARLAQRLRRRGLGPARDRRLTLAQARELRTALRMPRPDAPEPRWTRAEVAALIERSFAVRYHPQSIPGLLRRWNIPLVLAPVPRGDARPSLAQQSVLQAALQQSPVEAGIHGPRWEQRHLAHFLQSQFGLQYPVRGLYRRVQRWGIEIPARASAGGTCALTTAQRRTLADALADAPALCGYDAVTWSRALAARFILERFQIHYACGSIPHLLRREGLRLRPPRVAQPAVLVHTNVPDDAPALSSFARTAPAPLPLTTRAPELRRELSATPLPVVAGHPNDPARPAR